MMKCKNCKVKMKTKKKCVPGIDNWSGDKELSPENFECYKIYKCSECGHIEVEFLYTKEGCYFKPENMNVKKKELKKIWKDMVAGYDFNIKSMKKRMFEYFCY